MPTVQTPPPLLAVALKKQAMSLDAEMIRRLRFVHRLSFKLMHEFRLATKRQRARWRLGRSMKGRKSVCNAIDRLADAARLLAPMRDAYVMRRTMGRLARETGAGTAGVALGAATRELAAVARDTPSATFPALRERLIRTLVSDAASWRRLPASPDANARMLAGLTETYRYARRRGRRAMRRPTFANLHSWRKWVKIFIVHTEFVLGQRPNCLRTKIPRLVRLNRQLGRCHDLMLLDGWLALRASSGALNARDARRMRALLAGRQQSLRSSCVRLGRGLFAAKPKVFALRLSRAFHSIPKPQSPPGPP